MPHNDLDGATGHFAAESTSSSSNLDEAFTRQRGTFDANAGLVSQPGGAFRGGADIGRMSASATRAKLTMFDSSDETLARPGATAADNKAIWSAPTSNVPRYIARVTDPDAISPGLGVAAESLASAPRLATGAASRSTEAMGIQTQLANGTPARSGGPVKRATQSGAPASENAGADRESNAPIASLPSRLGVVGPRDNRDQQSNGATWNGAQSTQSDATSSATQPGSAQTTNSGPTGGDVYLDGTLMGRWMARNLATQASRPASGGAGFDPRRGVFPTGAMIGG
jgi:hypothetical protein